ncbi:hypothetical protein [Dokdonella soli]|uniref:hypothetical protein n=1 Tax=Dokdonella soli TaxID=529810 RepID=UPI0031DC60A7
MLDRLTLGCGDLRDLLRERLVLSQGRRRLKGGLFFEQRIEPRLIRGRERAAATARTSCASASGVLRMVADRLDLIEQVHISLATGVELATDCQHLRRRDRAGHLPLQGDLQFLRVVQRRQVAEQQRNRGRRVLRRRLHRAAERLHRAGRVTSQALQARNLGADFRQAALRGQPERERQ